MSHSRFSPIAFVFASIAALSGAHALADDLIFAEINPDFSGGGVSRVRTDGIGLVRLVEVGAGVRSVAIDSVDRKIYWTDVDNFVIERSNMDGSNPENIISSGLMFPSAITVDVSGRNIYWLDQDSWLARTTTEGANLYVLNQTTTYRGIAVDAANDRIYWTVSDTSSRGRIMVSHLDGSDVETAVAGIAPNFRPSAIALDAAAGKIYWTDAIQKLVCRSNVNGTNIETLWTGDDTFSPRGIALDLVHRHLYWGRDTNGETTSGAIMRATLDGQGPETILADIGLVNYLAYVPDCAADFNADGTLDFFDYLDFVAAFADGSSSADFNRDSVIDFFDYLDFVMAFSGGC